MDLYRSAGMAEKQTALFLHKAKFGHTCRVNRIPKGKMAARSCQK